MQAARRKRRRKRSRTALKNPRKMAKEEISLNNDVRVGKRKLHVQTEYSGDTRSAIISIFEGGALIDRREMQFEETLTEKELQKEIKQFHELVISDLELLFLVADKVRSSQHLPSIRKLGHLFYQKGFYDEAVEQFFLIKKADSEVANVDYDLGRALYKKGDFKASLNHLQAASSKNPDYPDLLLLLGQAHWKNGDYGAAVEQMTRAIKLNDRYHQAHYNLGLVLVESTLSRPKEANLAPPIERLKEAGESLKTALELSNSYDPDLMKSGLEKLETQETIEQAFSDFENALKPSRPTSSGKTVDSEFYLKFMFAGLDKDNRELKHYIRILEKSVAQHPDYADLHQSLGVAYLIKGWHFFAKATDSYRKAVDINPGYEQAVKKLKLLENDGRGFLILLRAILK